MAERQPSQASQPSQTTQGISNRELAREEEQERQEFPPLNTESPQPEDAAETTGEEPLEDLSGRQTSLKSGSQSTAQKEDESRYVDRPQPPSRKVAGAFGKEED